MSEAPDAPDAPDAPEAPDVSDVSDVSDVPLCAVPGVRRNDSNGPLQTIANLALFLPSIAVTARRLHDIDRSGWWQLIGLVPIVGWILMLIWTIRDGQPHQNRFGFAPKGELTGSAGYQNQNPGGYDGPQDYLPPRQ